MRNVGALISVTLMRERLGLTGGGGARLPQVSPHGGLFSDAVSRVVRLLVRTCVKSGGRLHQDTHRVAAEP